MEGQFTLKHKPAKGVIVLVEGGKVVFMDFKTFDPQVLAATALHRARQSVSGKIVKAEMIPAWSV